MRRLTLAYLRTESGAGLVLPVAAVAAVGLATSGYAIHYRDFVAAPIPVRLGGFIETLTVAGWVRALLMPVFFLVLGMQLKFELLRGELSGLRRLALPLVAALGGFVVPAALYLALALALHAPLSGWTVVCATDGAAALAMLTLTGPRLAASLRVLLVAVALIDNLAAMIADAVLAAGRLDRGMLAGAGLVLAALALLSRWRRAPFLFYAAGFVVVWGFALKSGLAPALAGLLCALTVPIGARRPGQESMLRYFMDSLHPYVAFAVLPLFVFTAAGFSLHHFHVSGLLAPQPLATMLAQVVGKPLGVFGLAAAAVSLKLARRPVGATWLEMLGVALIAGEGFTVSYFLAGAVGADAADATLRAAIFIASALAALAGGLLIDRTQRGRTAET
ncbi:MAG TPA: Na+/H+ antiporter NhaA [Caulobacteraceae bacterium]|jgi:NhaA family Na+:H+ antiporter